MPYPRPSVLCGARMTVRSSTVLREPPHPLVVTTDAELLDDLVRLAAAGGSSVRVAPDAMAARVVWDSAPLVLVGADAVASCAQVGFRARAAVVIATRGVPETLPWPAVETLRAEQIAVL